MRRHAEDISLGERFEFGANWLEFLKVLDDDRITQAERSLCQALGVCDLRGKRFLDAGSGSGLFSLAARRLGAEVTSFDYDPDSVACTREIKKRYFPQDTTWLIEEGFVLNPFFLSSLGRFDIVYSWGVLHHTGAMWEALGNISNLVSSGGDLYISIYNNQGFSSKVWRIVKKVYCMSTEPWRITILLFALMKLWVPIMVKDLLKGSPGATLRNYGKDGGRGMSPWRDLVDWVGGYPFEVAKPEEIFDLYKSKGFRLEYLKTCGGGLGCNQFIFKNENR